MATDVSVVRVFTDADGRFGNPLGIVAADDVAEADRQQFATDLGFSETVFVDLTGSGTASATIYTPAVELPFAGHPTVGLSWWLREQGHPVEVLTVPAAPLNIRYEGEHTWVRARADWTPHFTFHQVQEAAEVTAADPSAYDSGHHYVWAWTDEKHGALRSRMFAPMMGIAEDEATGAAAVRLTGELGRGLNIVQGAGSRLHTTFEAGWVELGGRTAADASISL
ncbi:PhzF family phenazine biosynthesis protein [Rhodococcus sp. IEGM 1401]|uniref:PhzF family phenazine biosynthesis protein n=1 Tax=unclassified Rhodococcus (in: high G+C Gram-positive bacteria) TaxID=192944 RepID=UPI0022B381A1|nr:MULTISPECIES: PhzF family phenazine biosynthesis protein [unclassified Rhodococcus (in: high G+C Gram-positive bacteria)]MCZ4563120.1 PhzF family phenazine biosynthesis protein [Rhodococcus sp. IEGM 1401]MDI9923243.1 PhzF family phenazine biosynthesis protein [Rhodococcus sp. IEGM 1372]MDV8035753.1 PhzF family phenazine biosynthesis protein [Rhodococcus sp. IEGM 1414]